ncbi:hypothetical protein R5576_16920 [Xanthomonas euvesicatoria]|uniref:Uncharacterized protein n=1 Tax=Xanthomonas euvesicatoria TaxID=456327 RepID=A0AAX4FML2_XANEU|nr:MULTISPECIES: hypothetical protein [Xanthomonas]WOP48965.1 hypothetical protein R2B60_04315 [Xanthomonas euvesicatoria]WOP51724.1 hypothetical protein R5576_16920 [Xanthomonas euvesicatoria]WOP57431.1 hypothetical protein R5577_04505 [Xanthomonas euvesicatoria]
MNNFRGAMNIELDKNRRGGHGGSDKISSARLISLGALINCFLPIVGFSISGFYKSSIASSMAGSNNFIWLRALETSFPESAFVLTISGLLALLISYVPLYVAVSRITLVRLAIFKDTIMVSLHKEGMPYRFSGLLAPLITSVISLVVVIGGPVDMAIFCNGGMCISENPVIFLISRIAIFCLIYASSLCAFVWGMAYSKLRKMK